MSPPLDLLRAVLDRVSDGFTAFDRDWHVTYMNRAAVDLLERLGRNPGELVGRRVWDAFPEMVGTRFHTEYLRAMDERVSVEFEEYYPPLEAWFQVRIFPSEDGLLAYTHDVTAEKRSQESLEERARTAALGADVGRALTSGRTLREMVQGCARAMVEHLDAAFARVWTLDAEGSVLELQASAGMYTHLDGGHSRVPVGQFKIGLIAQERKPHLTNSVVGDPRVGDQEWARREGMVSFAGYPLIVDDHLVGVAAMFARHPMSETVLATLAAVSDEIALGIVRAKAEEALRASREWLSTTLRSIGDAVIATDPDGSVTFMNQVAEDLTGWSMEEASNKPLADVFHIVNESSRGPVESPVEKVIREGGVVGLANHTVLIARDGTEVAIDDSAAPISDAEGKLRGVVLVFRDVTSQRQAQQLAEVQHRVSAALTRTETVKEAAAAVLEAVGETLGWTVGLLWLLDESTGAPILRAVETWQSGNEHRASPFEAASRELELRVGEGLPGLVLATGRPEWLEEIQRASNFPRSAVAASEGLKTGLAFPLRSNGSLLGAMEFFHTERRSPDANLLDTLGGIGQQVGQFIERRRAEAEVRSSEAAKSAILGAALDCIISMDQDGMVMEWNPVAEETFGYSREEAVGREMASLIIPPPLRDRHREGLSNYLQTGNGPIIGKRLEIMAVRRDGTEFPVELAVNRIGVGPSTLHGLHPRHQRPRAG